VRFNYLTIALVAFHCFASLNFCTEYSYFVDIAVTQYFVSDLHRF